MRQAAPWSSSGTPGTASRGRMLLLALVAGLAGGLAWLPLGLAPLLVAGWLLNIRALRLACSARDAMLAGLVFGAARYAVAAHYLLVLVRYSGLAVLLYAMAVIYILPFALLESGGAYWLERRSGLPRAVGFVLLYTLFEKVRTLGDLSFPADLVAHAFGAAPGWLAWSSWGGPFLIPLLGGGAAVVLDRAIERRHDRLRAAGLVGAALLLWTAPAASDLLSGRAAGAGDALRVGIVQPAVPLEEKVDASRWPEVRERLARLTREAAVGAELVVWPETARPGKIVWNEPAPFADPPMEALARDVGVPILYGCEIVRVHPDGRSNLYNAAALVFPDGRQAQWYGKQRLLPFVEGVPFGELLGWDPSRRGLEERDSLLTLLGNFTPGPVPTIFTVGRARIGVLICYEGVYPDLVRRYAREGANVLAVLTNDGWWGHSVFPLQHARLVSARARESRLPVIRAANTGISSSTDASGRMRARTELDEVRTLTVEVHAAAERATWYARVGDVSIWLVTLVLAGAVVIRRPPPRS